MRAIETEAERERKQKRSRLIVGVVLIVLMFGSTLGYAISLIGNRGDTITNDDGKPIYNGQYWVVTKGSQQFYITSALEDSSNVSVDNFISLASYQGKAVFVVADSDVIVQELSGVLSSSASRVQRACYGSCTNPDLPEKDCQGGEPLIVWKPAETRRVYTNQSCTFIEGDIVSVDAFLYRLLGM